MKKECIIIGAGTYGQVYKEYLSKHYTVTAYYDDDQSLHGKFIEDVEVKGDIETAIQNETGRAVFVPIGNNSVRVRILKEFENSGFEIPSFIHEKAIVHPSVKLGKAVYILPGTNIMPLSEIGDYCMMSVNSVISHHTTMNEGVFISFGVNVGASLVVNDLAYVGIGATLMTGVKSIGTDCLVGAGAVVIKDVPDYAIVAGVPAEVIRYKNQPTEAVKPTFPHKLSSEFELS